jgi:DnaK suppressor protein
MNPMSEAELLAAPTEDYMSPRQLAFFRARLQAERARLETVRANTGHLQENSDATADWTDRASCEEEHTLELRVRDRERKLQANIRAVLKRIDDGSYGWCEESGDPIGIARLLARPTATLSLEAQERREQRKRLFGD